MHDTVLRPNEKDNKPLFTTIAVMQITCPIVSTASSKMDPGWGQAGFGSLPPAWKRDLYAARLSLAEDPE